MHSEPDHQVLASATLMDVKILLHIHLASMFATVTRGRADTRGAAYAERCGQNVASAGPVRLALGGARRHAKRSQEYISRDGSQAHDMGDGTLSGKTAGRSRPHRSKR